MSLLHRLGLGFITIAVPVLAFAAAPLNVTGLSAVNENGKVRVTWTQVPGDIANYRIFYSHESILGNNGLYDDFESVDGSVNTHLLQNVSPALNEVFVSVLAVNRAGEESQYFVEEASVQFGAPSQASSVSSAAAMSSTMSSVMSTMTTSSIATQSPNANVLRLLSAEAISATGVMLRFTHPVTIPPAQATQAMMIRTASGTMLNLKRFIIRGNAIEVHTDVQERGTVYRLTVSPVITGRDPVTNMAVALDSEQAPVLFSGHINGKQPMTGTVSSPAANTKADITQLRLVAQPDGATTYQIEATWRAPELASSGAGPAADGVLGYLIAQTTDSGRTYGTANAIGTGATTLKVPRVPAGTFGVRVQTRYRDGTVSRGVTQIINLPRMQSGGTQGSVTPTPGGTTTLPNSGPALWLAVMGAGAVAGALKTRARKMKKA